MVKLYPLILFPKMLLVFEFQERKPHQTLRLIYPDQNSLSQSLFDIGFLSLSLEPRKQRYGFFCSSLISLCIDWVLFIFFWFCSFFLYLLFHFYNQRIWVMGFDLFAVWIPYVMFSWTVCPVWLINMKMQKQTNRTLNPVLIWVKKLGFVMNRLFSLMKSVCPFFPFVKRWRF